MGNFGSRIDIPDMEYYRELTGFSAAKIEYLAKQFHKMDPSAQGPATMRVPHNIVRSMTPQIKYNPFAMDMCRVFSREYGTGEDNQMQLYEPRDMAFVDYLDMFYVFSDNASTEEKTEFLFFIFDQDMDDFLDKQDLVLALKKMMPNPIDDPEVSDSSKYIALLADRILEEADLDGDHRISYEEFARIIRKAPDFRDHFRIRI